MMRGSGTRISLNKYRPDMKICFQKMLASVALATFLQVPAQSEQFGNWEVDAPPGSDPSYTLRATQALSASDLNSIEYFPKLSAVCEKWAIGPYGHGRTDYKTLSIQIQWFAAHLPKEFGS